MFIIKIYKADELQHQGFKNKNTTAKSRVKDYIEAKPENRSEKSIERGMNSKSLRSFYSERKPRDDELYEEEEADPFSKVIIEKDKNTKNKLSSPKNKYLSIASPTGKVDPNAPNKCKILLI